MITTNDIKRLLDSIDRLQFKPNHYEWLQDLLDEVEKQPTTAVHIAIVKSPNMFSEL